MGVYMAFMFVSVAFTLFGVFIGWSMANSAKSKAEYNAEIIIEELRTMKNKVNKQ